LTPRLTITQLSKRSDFIESRHIISQLVSRIPIFWTALILRDLELVQGTLQGVMGFSANVRSLTDEDRTTRELIFTSLLLQASSLPVETTVLTIFSRLSSMKIAGIRGTFWIVTTLSNTDALTPASPAIATASLGPDAWPTISSLEGQNMIIYRKNHPSALTAIRPGPTL